MNFGITEIIVFIPVVIVVYLIVYLIRKKRDNKSD